MKITFLAITFCMGVTNFAAALETDNNDLMRKIPLKGFYCEYCPDYAPYCYGICDYEEERCWGQCYGWAKAPKVSTSDKLAALSAALHSFAFGTSAGNTVSMFNNGVGCEITVTLSNTDGATTQFTVNDNNAASGQFTGSLESMLVNPSCFTFTCTLTTSQAGAYIVSLQKNKKGKVTGCNIVKQ